MMRRIIIILYCMALCVAVYGTPYTPQNRGADGYVQTYPTAQGQSYQYQFKSTSSYTPIVRYQTVKSIDHNGFVSNEYTTNNKAYKPRYANRGLDVDDDEPIGGKVPIGDPLTPLLILMIIYIIKHKRKKICIYEKKVVILPQNLKKSVKMKRNRIHIEPSDITIGNYSGGRSCFVERITDQHLIERCYDLPEELHVNYGPPS